MAAEIELLLEYNIRAIKIALNQWGPHGKEEKTIVIAQKR